MDVCFELLILDRQPLNSLEFNQKNINWGGVTYPQEPSKYIWGKYIYLVEIPIPQNLHQYLSRDFQIEDWLCFSIRGRVLDILALEVDGASIDWEGKTLKALFELILEPQKKWITVFEWQCDRIDNVYYLNIDECLQKIQENLVREKNREGFITMYPRLEDVWKYG